MRVATSSIVCIAFFVSSAAQGQARPTRSVDDYLCAFAGKCDGSSEPVASRDAPETKGFKLIRPTADASTAAPDTKGFKLVRPGDGKPAATKPTRPSDRTKVATTTQRPRPSAGTSRVKRPAYASTTVRRPSVTAERRADLLLSFELNSAELTPQAREEAKVFAESLLRPELSGKRFLIEGHTDSLGGRSYNLDLSQRRAAAVADYLASLGVEANRIDARGFGFDRPLAGRSAGAPENRRVEALLVN